MAVNKKFGSDNHAGVDRRIMEAIVSANKGYTVSYGEDVYTRNAVKKFQEHFGKNIDVYFVGNGTAANILGLKSVTKSFNSILCPETAHLNVHECGGPENYIGCKLSTVSTDGGKLSVNLLKPYISSMDDPHVATPKVVSITQPTELGTVYTPEEIKKLSDFAHSNGLLLHMDGARLCNAAASLDIDLKGITKDVGVDVLSFGGTKNGMMLGDAVLFFDSNLSCNFEYIRKQGMHLISKMRFISVQFGRLLSDNLWWNNAKHANRMAQKLYGKVKGLPDVSITQKVETNAVFASLPEKIINRLREHYFFYVFDEQKNIVRWMCSFDTTEEDVNKFVKTIKRI